MGIDVDGVDDLTEFGRTGCIGCGYCCRKAPCIYGTCEPGEDCKYLVWDGRRWRCQLIRMSGRYALALHAGEGCCCGLNTYRREGRVPGPDEVAAMRRNK